RRDDAAELDDEHHGVLQLRARVELRKRVADRGEHEVARENAGAVGRHHAPASRSSARFSSSTLTPGSPKKPRLRPSVFRSISLWTVASGRWRTAATRRDWRRAYAGEMSGSIPEPDVVTASTGMPRTVSPRSYGRSSSRTARACW